MSAQVCSIHRNRPTVAVFADSQNVPLWEDSPLVLDFVHNLGEIVELAVYDYWRGVPSYLERLLQGQGWRCLDEPCRTPDAADRLIQQDCERLCATQPPDIVVLITKDRDFVPLVKTLLMQNIRVVLIGQQPNTTSQRLKRLLPNGIVYIEDLKQLPLAS